jgi:hypothetical protein
MTQCYVINVILYLCQNVIIICAIVCDLCRGHKHSDDERTGLCMWLVMWAIFGLHPVWIFPFPEHYIVILYLCHNFLFSFVPLPVTYGETPSIHPTGEPGHVCSQLCGLTLCFTLSGYLHFQSNIL